MTRKTHWESVYTTKPAESVSWYQPHADRSLRMIQEAGLEASAAIIDIGSGASTLVDDLLQLGYANLTALDISVSALDVARRRMGPEHSARVQWLEADITTATQARHSYDCWHDRAVFHFLTEPADRRKYVSTVLDALSLEGT